VARRGVAAARRLPVDLRGGDVRHRPSTTDGWHDGRARLGDRCRIAPSTGRSQPQAKVVTMRIRRGLLFWGLFLIPLGVVPLLVRAGTIQANIITDLWRWWPLLLIALGIAVLLGRSQASLVGTALVALVLGTLGGSALASGNFWIPSIAECAGPGGQATALDRDGTFPGGATVTIDLDCGSVDLAVESGSGWRVHADYRGPAPRVEATGTGLELRTPDGSGQHRQDWTVAVGADALRDVDLQVNAASASAMLDGATLSRLAADMNAGDLRIDGSGATIDRLDLSVNAGRLRVTLDGPTSGALSVNAGAIELCAPADADLRLQVREQLTFATNLDGRGLTRTGDTWTRPGAGPRIDLAVEGNAASFTLDPEGGCK
jgi:hypothetical protein